MGWGYDDDYYGYYEPPPPDPIPNAIWIAGEVRAQSKREAIGTQWWGQQWITAIERVREDGRLDRGKRYARNGSVTDLEIAYGQAFAYVSGSQGRRYHSYVRLKSFTKEEWDAALDALAQQAIYTAKLLAGEMPGDIEAIFDDMGTSLFPRRFIISWQNSWMLIRSFFFIYGDVSAKMSSMNCVSGAANLDRVCLLLKMRRSSPSLIYALS